VVGLVYSKGRAGVNRGVRGEWYVARGKSFGATYRAQSGGIVFADALPLRGDAVSAGCR
jgi:hypothetical protein